MKHAALGHHGRRLPRYRPGLTNQDQRNVERAVGEPAAQPTTSGPAGGDKRQLRGIPVVGATTGAISGTDPLQTLLDQEEQEPRPTREPLENWLRGWIIDRDQATCYLCGLQCWPHEIHIDHVTPVARGGDNHPNNLRVTCQPCNLRKGKTMPDDQAPIMTRPKRPATPTSGRPPQPHQLTIAKSESKHW